jgi:cyclopropane-fatty-acyl-phospholipid synthase
MYDERFCRMWEFYLAACEGAFQYGSAMVFQVQLGRERDSAPLHRDYIGKAENAIAKREPSKLAIRKAA